MSKNSTAKLHHQTWTSGPFTRLTDVPGGYIAARHLIDIDRRRLAFAGGPDIALPVRDRLAGAEKPWLRPTVPITLEICRTTELQVDDGREFGKSIADRAATDRPDGIVTAADLLVLGIMHTVISESDIRIPDDLSITGNDNNGSAWDSTIPMTPVPQPGEVMGEATMRLLLE